MSMYKIPNDNYFRLLATASVGNRMVVTVKMKVAPPVINLVEEAIYSPAEEAGETTCMTSQVQTSTTRRQCSVHSR